MSNQTTIKTAKDYADKILQCVKETLPLNFIEVQHALLKITEALINEYASQQSESKDEEIERLKAILKVGNKTQKINELEATIQSQTKEIERFRKAAERFHDKNMGLRAKIKSQAEEIMVLMGEIQSLKKQLEEISKETDNEDW